MRSVTFLMLALITVAKMSGLMAQSTDFLNQVDFENSKKHLSKVVAHNAGDTLLVNGFKASLESLIQLSADPEIRKHLKMAMTYSQSNNYERDLEILRHQLGVLKLKQTQLDSIRRELVMPEKLVEKYDTADVSTSDSIFADLVQDIFADSLIRDSIQHQMDVLGQQIADNDTLIASLQKAISGFETDSLFNFIVALSSDTTYFYLVNIEGDSMLIKLHSQSPELIKFDITDYWGNSIPAVIRNINRNSMRLLIDDVPEIDNNTDDQAKDAISGLKRISKGLGLTIQPRILPGPKCWQLYGNTNLDITQVGMKNWVKGGEPSMSVLAGLELFAKYKMKNISWDNTGRFRYGVLRQGEYTDTTAHWAPNEDRIEITSKFGTKIYSEHHYLTMMADFKSQFAPNYKYVNNVRQDHPVSEFMSPGYITLAFGVDYKPNSYATFYVAPISDKSTFVLNPHVDPRQYGLDSADNVRNELGLTVKAIFKNKVWGNIEMEHLAEFFSNYLHNPENIDIDWQMKVIFPVNDFIRATLSTSLIYDHDVNISAPTATDPNHTTKAVQFKEMIALGFAMKF